MGLKRQLSEGSAYASTYEKGRKLYASGGVLSCEVEQGPIEGAVHLFGTVRSSHPGMAYQTGLLLDVEEGSIIDHFCTCPVGDSQVGVCKHVVALGLHYLAATQTWEEPGLTPGPVGAPPTASGSDRAQGAGAYGGRGRRSQAYSVPTSPQISELIAGAAEKRVKKTYRPARAERQEEDDQAPVELLASLSPAEGGMLDAPQDSPWLLKLRVRRDKATYVVKNVAELTRAYLARREHSYGKRLSFVHEPSAFDERSLAVLDLIVGIVESQQALFLSRWNYSGAGRGADVKELPLSASDVVRLLDCLQGSRVDFEPGGYPARPSRSLLVTTGEPHVEALVEKVASGGYDLRLPGDLHCFASPDELYLLDQTRALRCPDDYARAARDVLLRLLPASRPLHIAEKDLPEFCRSALPSLGEVAALDVPPELVALTPPAPSFSFDIGLEDGEVTCVAKVAYDGRELGLYEPQRAGQPPRDMAAEYHAQDVVERYFHGVDDDLHFDESDDEMLFALLTEGLRELGETGEVRLSERLRAVEVRDSPQIRVKASVRDGLLDVAVDASGLSPQDLASYLASYKRHQRFIRLSDGDIVKIGDDLRALESLSEGLNVDLSKLATGVDGLPEGLALFVDGLLKQRERKSAHVRLERDRAFRAIVRELETFSEADIEMPTGLLGTLRPYQEEGVRWLGTLERLGLGGILADDMGLGKTLQVIAHILADKEAHAREGAPQQVTLVVAPASLVYNWTAELARFAPALEVAAVVGTKAAREKLISDASDHDVLVTSYDLMKRDVRAYASQRFRRVVLDEAQYIKNPGTQVAKSAKCLPAETRIALTGTPVENRLAELWSIFDFLMPGVLGSRDSFSKRFEGPVEHGDAKATRALQCLVSPFILRRMKEDVLADLPEKTEGIVMAEMGAEQEKLYLANQDRIALQVQHQLPEEFKKERLKVLAELTKLRQICCDPRLCYENYDGGSAKLDTCTELVRTAIDGGHRVLVFSQFTTMLDLLASRLNAEHVKYLLLTGATNKEERARLVSTFQAGKADVFLISLKAGGVGLNLTAADTVIHYDPWWNLAAQNQATDRAHRIGQRHSVNVVRLIMKGTVEERIVKMQERKRDLAEAVLGGEGLSSSRVTKEDILGLLGSAED